MQCARCGVELAAKIDFATARHFIICHVRDHGAMRAVGSKYGRAHMSTDLRSAEQRCLAILPLQRGRRAVQAVVPVTHDIRFSLITCR